MKLTSLTAEAIAKGEAEYRDTMTADNRIVRDDTITPWMLAMTIDGYSKSTAVSSGLNVTVLRVCPSCRGSYSGKYTKGEGVFWSCPHCQTIEQVEG